MHSLGVELASGMTFHVARRNGFNSPCSIRYAAPMIDIHPVLCVREKLVAVPRGKACITNDHVCA